MSRNILPVRRDIELTHKGKVYKGSYEISHAGRLTVDYTHTDGIMDSKSRRHDGGERFVAEILLMEMVTACDRRVAEKSKAEEAKAAAS